MTTQEATEVFSMVAAVYGLHPERTAGQAIVWVRALEELDVNDTMQIVQDYLHGRGPERLPTVVAFVQAVKALRGAPEPAGELQEAAAKPLWVVMWEIAREDGLNVVLPEQEGGYRQLYAPWPPGDRELLEEGDAVYEDLKRRALERPQEPLRKAWEPTYDCLVCLDDGFVEVGRGFIFIGGERRQGVEEMAPCPACDRGKLIEHPLNGRSPWGPEGFWRGQRWETVRSGVVEVSS